MAGNASDVELAQVQRSIKRWRRSPSRVSPMPEELWTRAVALTQQRSISRVSTALGLGYYGLRRRAQSGTAMVGGSPGFVEMRGAELLVNAPPGDGTVIEVRTGDGAQLTVRLAKGASLDVVDLVERFRAVHS